jgi:hypothetical protein
MYTVICGDGSAPRFILVSDKKNIPVRIIDPKKGDVIVLKSRRKGTSGRGTDAYERVVDCLVKAKILPPGSFLYTDNERALQTEPGDTLLEEHGITHLTFPTYMGQLLNTCDNSFHSIFARKFAEALEGKISATVQDKVQAAYHSYYSISRNAIRNMFKHCGLTGTRDINQVVHQLVHEGVQPRARRLDLYKGLIRDALEWAGNRCGQPDTASAKYAVWSTFLDNCIRIKDTPS